MTCLELRARVSCLRSQPVYGDFESVRFLIGDWLLEREDRPPGLDWAKGTPAFLKGRHALGGHVILVEWYELTPGVEDPRDAEIRHLWTVSVHDRKWSLTILSPGSEPLSYYSVDVW